MLVEPASPTTLPLIEQPVRDSRLLVPLAKVTPGRRCSAGAAADAAGAAAALTMVHVWPVVPLPLATVAAAA